jgi:cytochrome c peroxidase
VVSRPGVLAQANEVGQHGDGYHPALGRGTARHVDTVLVTVTWSCPQAPTTERALTDAQKRGGVVFFTKGGCVACHAVSGESSEMFSDFKNYRIGVPPLAPEFGVGKGNVRFAGPAEDEDLGAEHSTGDPADRYAFRATPLRNIALQPNFFHNGSFDKLENAIRHHLNVYESARNYDPAANGVPADLRVLRPPLEPVLANIHPRLRTPIALTEQEFNDLVSFVRDALLDARASSQNLCRTIPTSVPSGMTLMNFQGC